MFENRLKWVEQKSRVTYPPKYMDLREEKQAKDFRK